MSDHTKQPAGCCTIPIQEAPPPPFPGGASQNLVKSWKGDLLYEQTSTKFAIRKAADMQPFLYACASCTTGWQYQRRHHRHNRGQVVGKCQVVVPLESQQERLGSLASQIVPWQAMRNYLADFPHESQDCTNKKADP